MVKESADPRLVRLERRNQALTVALVVLAGAVAYLMFWDRDLGDVKARSITAESIDVRDPEAPSNEGMVLTPTYLDIGLDQGQISSRLDYSSVSFFVGTDPFDDAEPGAGYAIYDNSGITIIGPMQDGLTTDRPSVTLGMYPERTDGSPVLWITDPGGTPRIYLGALDDTPALRMFGVYGRAARRAEDAPVNLSVTDSDGATLRLQSYAPLRGQTCIAAYAGPWC
jgi:hypothetical protein